MRVNGYTSKSLGLTGLLGNVKIISDIDYALTAYSKECPDNMGILTNRYCEDCSSSLCKTCDGTASTCTACFGSFIVSSGSCTCPSG